MFRSQRNENAHIQGMFILNAGTASFDYAKLRRFGLIYVNMFCLFYCLVFPQMDVLSLSQLLNYIVYRMYWLDWTISWFSLKRTWYVLPVWNYSESKIEPELFRIENPNIE